VIIDFNIFYVLLVARYIFKEIIDGIPNIIVKIIFQFLWKLVNENTHFFCNENLQKTIIYEFYNLKT
jgi:hypothetical protein